VTFTWTAGTNVTAYWLDVGTAPFVGNYYAGNQGIAAFKVVSGLPTDGSTVCVTLYSLIGGVWLSNTYLYTAASIAQMTSPTPGSTLAGPSVTFTWTAGTGATAYWLDVGPAPFNGSYFAGNVGLATSKTVSGLPMNGSTVYATLYAQIAGVWPANMYIYVAWHP